MIRRVPYEMPRGYAGTRVEVQRHLLDKTVSVVHDGRLVELRKVDTILNGVTRRKPAKKPSLPPPVPPTTAATMAFNKTHQPLVGLAGDCYEEC